MRSVFQDEEYGCGIACIAMLCSISYRSAKRLCSDIYVPGEGIHEEPMLALLEHRGARILDRGRLSAATPVTSLTHNALLWGSQLPSRGTIVHHENTWNHWLVWDARNACVRDPYRYRKPVWLTKYYLLDFPR